MKTTAIILAAGKGARMNSDIQKQYMSICGKPLLYYPLKTFYEGPVDEIILVVGRGEIEYCKKNIIDKYNFKKVAKIVEGGTERYESVYNGLQAVGECDIIAIHDGARPFVTAENIADSIKCAAKYGACVVGTPVKDTIKTVDDDFTIVSTPVRKTLWIAQTPQTFRYNIIKSAYDRMIADKNQDITDDAMVAEIYENVRARFVMGSYKNIKVTTPEDIDIAEMFCSQKINFLLTQ